MDTERKPFKISSSTQEDFILQNKIPIKKRNRMLVGKLRRRYSELSHWFKHTLGHVKNIHHPLGTPIVLSTFTHILLFFYLFYSFLLLSPHSFTDRILSLFSGISMYLLSQYILIKSFEAKPILR